MTPVRLDIFSDPVCPWCMIGKANLDRALGDAPDHPFVLRWHPFQLNPDMPPEGMDKRQYLEAKFGADRLGAMHERLREVARAAGVDLDPEIPKRMPNTADAHRLIHWAGIEGPQHAVVGALMRAYWTEGRDIGNPSVLADIGAAEGMDRDALVRLLASEADADDLRAREDDARSKGLNAVPTFLVAQAHVVSGAQPADLWARVIEDLRARA
jgi:predicted DsbA family dithiol-disulfide isomerase